MKVKCFIEDYCHPNNDIIISSTDVGIGNVKVTIKDNDVIVDGETLIKAIRNAMNN